MHLVLQLHSSSIYRTLAVARNPVLNNQFRPIESNNNVILGSHGATIRVLYCAVKLADFALLVQKGLAFGDGPTDHDAPRWFSL